MIFIHDSHFERGASRVNKFLGAYKTRVLPGNTWVLFLYAQSFTYGVTKNNVRHYHFRNAGTSRRQFKTLAPRRPI